MTISIHPLPTPPPTRTQSHLATPCDGSAPTAARAFPELLDHHPPDGHTTMPGEPTSMVAPAAFAPAAPDQYRDAAVPLSGAPAHRFDAFGMFGYADAIDAPSENSASLHLPAANAAPPARTVLAVADDNQPAPFAAAQSLLPSTAGLRPPVPAAGARHPTGRADQYAPETACTPTGIGGNAAALGKAEYDDALSLRRPAGVRSGLPPTETSDPAVNLTIFGENDALEIVARTGKSDPLEREALRHRIESVAAEHGYRLAGLQLDGIASIPTPFSIGINHGH